MSKPKAPTPPDPQQTAAAQTGTNVSTAVANNAMNQINQVGPGGSLTYKQTGSYDWRDPATGQTYSVPRMTAETAYSPEQQKIYDQSNRAQLGMASIAADQTERAKALLSTPYELETSYTKNSDFTADRQRVEDAIMGRLEERRGRDMDQLRTQLVNQGVNIGSEAYSRALKDFEQTNTDMRTNAILSAGQEQSRLLGESRSAVGFTNNAKQAMRNQPINEITALLSGSQVSAPNFQLANTANMPTLDYAGLMQQNFSNQQQKYQQGMQNYRSNMGGLFNLATAAITGMPPRNPGG